MQTVAACANLSANTVAIWLTPFPSHITPALLASVTQDEQARAKTFGSVRRQTEWLTGRALLRNCLALYTGQDALSLVFGKTDAGKPTLDLTGAPAFNLSHGPRWLACAVSQGANIGIDIDCSARRNRLQDIAQRYFHPQEQLALQQSVDEADYKKRFFTHWCLKEAYIKARGEMINSVRLHDIAFAEDGALFALPEGEHWQFRHWQFDGDHHLALACQQPSAADARIDVRFFSWDPVGCAQPEICNSEFQ